tara:strand:- start:2172 stop:2657 length:486 start_codon:yes stop_codon:yes gene_type:complete
MADMAGIPKNTQWEGRSLMPILKKQVKKWEEVTLTTFSIGSHSVSTPNWQLISYFDGSYELYDMINDPDQFKNLANQPSKELVINQLKKHIPEESRWSYFIRYGDYKILVPQKGEIQVFDQMLEGRNDKDISEEMPDLVKKIKAYIHGNKPNQKKFTISVL